CGELASICATLLACGLILLGEGFVTLAFGAKYKGAGAIVAWLATANAIRIMRAIPTLAAMARGDTMNNLISNIFRVLSLAFGLACVYIHAPITWIAACGVIGEIFAITVSWRRLKAKQGVSVWASFKTTAPGIVFIALSGAAGMIFAPSDLLVR